MSTAIETQKVIEAQSAGLFLRIDVNDKGVTQLSAISNKPITGEHLAQANIVEVHGENEAGIYHANIGNRRIVSLPGLDCFYHDHQIESIAGGQLVTVVLHGPGVEVQWQAQLYDHAPAMRVQVSVKNLLDRPQLFTGVASFSYAGLCLGSEQPWYDTGHLHECVMTWCGELQWRSRSAREIGLWPPREKGVTSFRHVVRNVGTWSTGERLPMAIWERTDGGDSLCWQIEHNGSWSYEIGDTEGMRMCT